MSQPTPATPADPLYLDPAVKAALDARRAERAEIDEKLQDLADTEALLTEQLAAVNAEQLALLERRGALGLVPTAPPVATPTPAPQPTPPTTVPAPAPADPGTPAPAPAPTPTPAPAPADPSAGDPPVPPAPAPAPTTPTTPAPQPTPNEPKGFAKIMATIKDHPIASGIAGSIAAILVIGLWILLVAGSIGSANAGEGGWIVIYVLVGIVATVAIVFSSLAVALNIAKPKSHDIGHGTDASAGLHVDTTPAPASAGTAGSTP